MNEKSEKAQAQDETVRRAQEAVAAIAGDYLLWARTECKRLQALHGQGMTDRDGRPALQEQIYRAAHDLKGQGRSFGFDLVTDIGALLCALLDGEERIGDEDWTAVGHHLSVLEIVLAKPLNAQSEEKNKKDRGNTVKGSRA